MMVALLLYAYARGTRSSRAIERAVRRTSRSGCWRRSSGPITRRSRGSSSATRRRSPACSARCCRCARSRGLASVGVIAVDGTKLAGNASRNANVDYEQLAREILEEAQAVDAAEDELYGDARGDELPEQLRTGEGRRAWLREAKRQLEEQRAKEARPVPRSRGKRLKEAKRRLDEELWSEMRANRAYEHYRSRAHEGRAPLQPPAGPLHATGDAAGPDQPHRSRLARRQGLARPRVPAGLQRAGRRQRAPDRDRGRGDDRRP